MVVKFEKLTERIATVYAIELKKIELNKQMKLYVRWNMQRGQLYAIIINNIL